MANRVLRKLHSGVHRMHDPILRFESRALSRFTHWFDSQGGVYQTFFITMGIVVFEAMFPRIDTHGFYLLYWLTVYSAITQPALAHSGKIAALLLRQFVEDAFKGLDKKLDRYHEETQGRLRALERQNAQILRKLEDLSK